MRLHNIVGRVLPSHMNTDRIGQSRRRGLRAGSKRRGCERRGLRVGDLIERRLAIGWTGLPRLRRQRDRRPGLQRSRFAQDHVPVLRADHAHLIPRQRRRNRERDRVASVRMAIAISVGHKDECESRDAASACGTALATTGRSGGVAALRRRPSAAVGESTGRSRGSDDRRLAVGALRTARGRYQQ